MMGASVVALGTILLLAADSEEPDTYIVGQGGYVLPDVVSSDGERRIGSLQKVLEEAHVMHGKCCGARLKTGGR